MSDPTSRSEPPAVTVDVIVPTNRVGKFLPEALASVAGQDFTDWRVILIDDGSGAAAKLDALASKLDRSIVVHQDAKGVSAARNAGLRLSNAEFVTFLDDDDVWPPTRLGTLVSALRSRLDASGAFGDGRYIDSLGQDLGGWRTAGATQHEFLGGFTPIPRITALMVRRSSLSRLGGFDESLDFSEDDELILRLLRDAPLVGTGEVVVRYRRHEENATRADWRIRFESAVVAVSRNLEEARRAGRADQVRLLQRNLRRLKKSTAEASTGRAAYRLRRGEFLPALRELVAAARISVPGTLEGVVLRLTTRFRPRAK